jgi:hypothetical protein
MGMTKEAKSKYYAHRSRARASNIDWNLTFDEWYNWWLSTGKWSQRGTGSNCYHMCRYNDTGPYSLDNIYCDTAKNNVGLANKNNPRLGFKRTDENRKKCREVNIIKCKKVKINGIVYIGMREASRQTGISRSLLYYRLKRNISGYEYA